MAMDLSVRIDADGRAFVNGMEVVKRGIDDVEQKGKQAGISLNSAFEGAKGQLLAFASVAAGLSFAKAFIEAADAATTLQSRLRLVTSSTQELATVQTRLFDIANASRVSVTDLGDTYSKIARVGNDMGISQERLLGVTQTISQAMTIGGGAAASMNAALVQLGQGMGAGTLRGEELNSVIDQTPRLARAIADGMGISMGQLKLWGEQGRISSQAVIEALEKTAKTVSDEFGKMTPTVGQSTETLKNNLINLAGQFDQLIPITKAVVIGIDGISSALGGVTKKIKELNDSSANNQVASIEEMAKRSAKVAQIQALGARRGLSDPSSVAGGKLSPEAARQLSEALIKQDQNSPLTAKESMFDAFGKQLTERYKAQNKQRENLLPELKKRNEIEGKIKELNAAFKDGELGINKADLDKQIKTYKDELAKLDDEKKSGKSRKAKPEYEINKNAGVINKYFAGSRVGIDGEFTQSLAMQSAAQLEAAHDDWKAATQIEQEIAKSSKKKEEDVIRSAQKASEYEGRIAASAVQYKQRIEEQNREVSFQLSLIGKTALERERLTKINQVENEFLREQARIKAQIAAIENDKSVSDEDKLKMRQFSQSEMDNLRNYTEQQKNVVNQTNSLQLAQQQDFFSGARQAWANYASEASNLSGQVTQSTSRMFSSMEDSLIRATQTGKISFKDMANSVIADLTRIWLRKQITGFVMNMAQRAVIGQTTSGGFESDLSVGGSASNVGAINGSFASGGYASRGNAYLVGERAPEIFVPTQSGRIMPIGNGSGGVSAKSSPTVNVTQNISIDSRSDQASIMSALIQAKEQAKNEIMDSLMRGGQFASAVGRA